MPDNNKFVYIEYTIEELNDLLKRIENIKKVKINENGEVEKDYIIPINGGIGPKTPETNALLVGYNDESLKTILSKEGALFSKKNGGLPNYGTLPIKYGGTGATNLEELKIGLGLAGDQNSGIAVTVGGTGSKEFNNN